MGGPPKVPCSSSVCRAGFGFYLCLGGIDGYPYHIFLSSGGCLWIRGLRRSTFGQYGKNGTSDFILRSAESRSGRRIQLPSMPTALAQDAYIREPLRLTQKCAIYPRATPYAPQCHRSRYIVRSVGDVATKGSVGMEPNAEANFVL